MNNTSTISNEDIINNNHNRSVPENYYCPTCDGKLNKIKSSGSLDTYQEYNEFSLILPKNLHQTTDHNSERLLKLSPYSILNTDPTLDNSNLSIALSRIESLGKDMLLSKRCSV